VQDALRLLSTTPESPERDREELGLQLLLGPLVVALKGFSSPEMGRLSARSQELLRRIGEAPQIFGVMFGVWGFQFAIGHLVEARSAAERLLNVAERVQNELAIAGASNSLGSTLMWMGEFRASRNHLEKAAAFYDTDVERYLPMIEAAVIPS